MHFFPSDNSILFYSTSEDFSVGMGGATGRMSVNRGADTWSALSAPAGSYLRPGSIPVGQLCALMGVTPRSGPGWGGSQAGASRSQ